MTPPIALPPYSSAPGPRTTSIRLADEGSSAVVWSAPEFDASATAIPSSSISTRSPPRPRITGCATDGPILVAASPGIDARVCATVAVIWRCSTSPAMTLTGRSASAAARSLIVAVTTRSSSAMGDAASSITTSADSATARRARSVPTVTTTVAPRYPTRSARRMYAPAAIPVRWKVPSPRVTALASLPTTETSAPASGSPVPASRTLPSNTCARSVSCAEARGATSAGAMARHSARARGCRCRGEGRAGSRRQLDRGDGRAGIQRQLDRGDGRAGNPEDLDRGSVALGVRIGFPPAWWLSHSMAGECGVRCRCRKGERGSRAGWGGSLGSRVVEALD